MNHKVFAYFITIMLLTTSYITIVKTSSGLNIESIPNIYPVADANGPYYGIVNQPITFDGSNSYDSDGSIILYEWFCGYNNFEYGMITQHTYTQPGNYKLILMIEDNDGNYDCDQTEVIIYEDNAPFLEIIHPIEKSIYFNDNYLFPYNKDTILIGTNNIVVNVSDDVGINRVEFYFDNDLIYTDYDEPYNWTINKGHLRHNITIIAYDSSGQQTSTEIEFFQWKIHPVLIIFIAYILLKNKDYDFSWISNEHEWNSLLIKLLTNLQNLDFNNDNNLREFIKKIQNQKDDLTTSIIIKFLNNHPILKNRFREKYPFIYFILFYVKNEDSIIRDKILHSFYKDKNLISILFSTPSIIELLKNSDIYNSKTFDSSIPYEWIKNHPYITLGTILLIILLIRNLRKNNIEDNNESDAKSDNIAPVAKAGGPYYGYQNNPISFSAVNSYDTDGYILTYEWDFGDGNKGNGKEVKHSYSKNGNYTVTLTVTDDNGKTDYDTTKVQITSKESDEIYKEDNGNQDYVIISGFLSTILLIGLIGLKYRRKYFE